MEGWLLSRWGEAGTGRGWMGWENGADDAVTLHASQIQSGWIGDMGMRIFLIPGSAWKEGWALPALEM